MKLKNLKNLPVFDKITLLMNRVYPSWAENKIDSLLFMMNRRGRSSPRAPRGFEQKYFKTKDGELNAYMIGRGPAIVFVHGWGGGAYQFFSLMRGLKECGFRAIAFDHLGHEASEHKPATIEQMIRSTNVILGTVKNQHQEGLYSIVTHGIGAMVVTNAQKDLIRDVPLFLIAPVFNYRFYFLKLLGGLNMHSSLVKQYAQQFSANYKAKYARMELAKTLKPHADSTVIVHDHNDSVTPIADSIKFTGEHPLTKLLATRKFDHQRIITSESAWQELKSHINYEDTTINFSSMIVEDAKF